MDPNSAAPSNGSSRANPDSLRFWWIVALVCLIAAIAARLIQHDLLWVEEAYGLAAAAELLRGKVLYRDIWFDKPPFYAWFYVLCGAQPGWPLRLLGSLHTVAAAGCIKWTGERLWGPREGLLASALCSLALTFWIPSAVMAVAPDLLMLLPHVLAVGLAVQRRPLLAGMASGVALLCNSRGVFVLLAAALWTRAGLRALVGGFLTIQLLSALILPVGDYWQEVWVWGFVYSSATFLAHPVREALVRTFAWAGFHASAVSGTVVSLIRERNSRIACWLLISLVAVAAGWRFFPRYYFHLLPVVALAGARGLLLLRPRMRAFCLALLLVPILRFGPRYISLATSGTAGWADAAMMEDSRAVGQRLRALHSPQATLLVWGYRPDVFVFSGLAAGTRFLDSQPLTGVLADRHLTHASVLYPELAVRHRSELIQTTPDLIVDGLGPLNPQLGIGRFPDLAVWLRQYEVVAHTRMSVIYRKRPDGLAPAEKR